MHPEKLGISACDLESLLQDQSTQTSTISIDKLLIPSGISKSSRPPLPRDISKSDKGSITVFEFCQVIQNPESPQDVTIIKETVTEETKPHTSTADEENKSSTSLEELTANRYKYCREVIKPYLKHSADCPESEEELLKNALDSVSEDFPDYQPCFEIFDAEKSTSEKTTEKSSRRSSISKVDASTSTSCSSSMEDTNKCVPKTNSTEKFNAPQCPTPAEQSKELVLDCTPKPKCNKNKCSPKPSSIVLCSKCDTEPAIGVKCKNPSYYLTERCKDADSIPNIPAKPEESFIDNHKKTISTIKVAMDDFVSKVYKTTKDAVTLITTESAKQIDKVKQMKTECSNTDEMKKSGEAKSSETLTSFNFFRKVESTNMEEKSSGTKPELPKISDVLGNIKSKVDSTISTISDHISLDNLPKRLKPQSFNDTNSPYDTPSTPPREVSNILIPTPAPLPAPVPASNSVFATIKDKIVSMFREGEPKPAESPSRTSTMSSSSSLSENSNNEDTDDQLIDKVID